jgi:hypothetical protein
MSDITIKEFSTKHEACRDGIDWAEKNCPSGMMSEAYEKLSQATDSVEVSYFNWTWQRSFDRRTLRLLAVRFARDVQHLAPGADKIIDVVERYANGEATRDELLSAWESSGESARTSAWESALGSARALAWASAGASALESSGESAGASAWESALGSAIALALESARTSAWESDVASAWKKYRGWILELGNPFLEGKHEWPENYGAYRQRALGTMSTQPAVETAPALGVSGGE